MVGTTRMRARLLVGVIACAGGAAAVAAPQPKPDPQPQPQPEPKPDPKPQPDPQPKPKPKPDPRPTPTAPTNALTWRSCGPTDGPAQVFEIADHDVTCADQPTHVKWPRAEIELWSMAVIVEPAREIAKLGGMARRCEADNRCRDLAGATIAYHHAIDGTIIGTFTFRDHGKLVTHTFRAVACDVHIECG